VAQKEPSTLPTIMAPPAGWERPKISESILDHIGMTPLVRVNKLGANTHSCEILAKCEFLSAGGSVKDRIGKRMILDAEKQGRIKPGDTLIEPTSGNTGIGLALTALVRGYRMVITLPEKMSNEKMNLLKALGAEIIRTPTEAAWDAPDSHIGVANRLHAQIPNSHILDQYANPSNPLAHYEGTAEEILHQCDGRVDMVVVGAGTGGTITGIARRLREVLGERVKIVGVDPQGSILAEPSALNAKGCGESYLVEGIGYDFVPPVLDRSLVDEWIKTDDASAFKMARRLIREEGLLCGGSSGAAMHAALLAAAHLGAGKRVVVILPDSTRNYMSKFLTDEWMVDNDLEPPSLHTRSSAVLRLLNEWMVDNDLEPPPLLKSSSALLGLTDEPSSTCDEWWAQKTAADLRLSSPITVPPTMSCGAAAALMSEHGIDQLPVVDDGHGVVGVLTLGHLTSKILGKAATPREPCSKLMFTQFAQAPLATPLTDLSRVFERHAFCIVVEPILHATSLDARRTDAAPPPTKKDRCVAVCTQVDLLKFVMDGSAVGETRREPEARRGPVERGNEMDCAQLAWQFMRPAPPPSPAQRPKTNRAADLSRGRHELDCSAYAWSFMKPPSPARSPALSQPVAQPTNRSDDLSRGRHELDCAAYAWQFMKPPASPARSAPSAQRTNRAYRAEDLSRGPHEMDCSQLAWAFMKPASPARSAPAAGPVNQHFASPMLESQRSACNPPKLDLTTLGDGQSSSDDTSGQPTRFATPDVTAVKTGKAVVESLKLPKSLQA